MIAIQMMTANISTAANATAPVTPDASFTRTSWHGVACSPGFGSAQEASRTGSTHR